MSKRIIKAGLCLMRGGKVLLARSEGDTHFQIPGGKIEPGETDLQALVRESQEELALSLDPEEATILELSRPRQQAGQMSWSKCGSMRRT